MTESVIQLQRELVKERIRAEHAEKELEYRISEAVDLRKELSRYREREATMGVEPELKYTTTPTQREALYPPDVIEAWHWIKQHCRHYATVGYDTQTTEFLSVKDMETAAQHIALLNKHDLLITTDFNQKPFYHKNFVVLNFGESASGYYNRCKECHK